MGQVARWGIGCSTGSQSAGEARERLCAAGERVGLWNRSSSPKRGPFGFLPMQEWGMAFGMSPSVGSGELGPNGKQQSRSHGIAWRAGGSMAAHRPAEAEGAMRRRRRRRRLGTARGKCNTYASQGRRSAQVAKDGLGRVGGNTMSRQAGSRKGRKVDATARSRSERCGGFGSGPQQ